MKLEIEVVDYGSAVMVAARRGRGRLQERTGVRIKRGRNRLRNRARMIEARRQLLRWFCRR